MKSGSIILSNVLAMGESKEMGRYEVPIDGSLFCLGIGIIFASFQMWGI